MKEKNLNDELKCEKIEEYKKNINYKISIKKNNDYSKLNDLIKNNLFKLNDQMSINQNNKISYIILCDINFDKEIIKNINLTKRINIIVQMLEGKFINEMKKKYKIIFYD